MGKYKVEFIRKQCYARDMLNEMKVYEVIVREMESIYLFNSGKVRLFPLKCGMNSARTW